MKTLSQYTSRELEEISAALDKAASGRFTCADTIEKLLAKDLIPASQKAEALCLRREAALIAQGAELIEQISAQKQGRAA